MVCNVCLQRSCYFFAIFFLRQSKVQCQHTSRLRFAHHPACARDVLLVKQLYNHLMKRSVLFRILLIPEHFCRPAHNIRGIGIVRICHQILVCRACAVRVLLFVQRQPVTILVARLPQTVLPAMRCDIVHIALHALILVLKYPLIPEHLIDRPRNHCRCIAPRCCRVLIRENIWNHVRRAKLCSLFTL